jgi:hypothetical protein
MWEEFMRTWRRRKETLGVFSLYAKRYKSVYISVNNNTNLNLFKILSNYIIWDRLSQKTHLTLLSLSMFLQKIIILGRNYNLCWILNFQGLPLKSYRNVIIHGFKLFPIGSLADLLILSGPLFQLLYVFLTW